MSVETIEIKFRFPFDCFLWGTSAQELDFHVEFVEGDFCVQATLEKSEPIVPKVGEFKGQYFCTSQSIQFHMKSNNFLRVFQQPTDELRNNDSFKQKIYEIGIRVLNRVLRNLRIYGFAPHIHEQTLNMEQLEISLKYWNSQFRIDSNEWLPVFDKDKFDLQSYFAGNWVFGPEHGLKTPEITTVHKRDIIEAIEDNLEPPPEQEFGVNALEFLRERNFRMAVVESVIGLEIVLTLYISLYLEKKKNLSKPKSKNFSKGVGLKNRFDIVLKLTTAEEDLKGVDTELVLKTIEWRNDIVHDGQLKRGIPESYLRQGIASVITVCYILRSKIYQIESEPMFQTIVDELKEKHCLSALWLYPVTLRKIYMDLNFFLSATAPSKQSFQEIIDSAIGLISVKKPRFNPKEDFYAKIHVFPRLQPVAVYSKGKLEMIESMKQTIE